MPTAAEPWLVDTSAAVAMLVADHEQHEQTFAALSGRRLGLCGHAAFESYSVLTRLPGVQRLSPPVARRLLTANFPQTRHLGAEAARALLAALSEHRIAGGAVYDALVAAAAVEHGLVLVSRDRRAAQTYQRLGARVELLV
jgi:predicted nucleic acid-binding protein